MGEIMMETLTFAEGEFAEGFDWEIQTNVDVQYAEPCKHCYNDRMENRTTAYDETYSVRTFTGPRAVVAYNEGGHNGTMVCLDCILEAAETLGKDKAT